MDANFPNWLYLFLFLFATITSSGSARKWIGLAKKRGWVDLPGPRKIHSKPLPLAGGFMIATGILIPLIIAILALKLSLLGEHLSALFSHGLSRRSGQLTGLICGAIGMLGLGWMDDKGALSAGKKLLLQSLIILLVVSTGTRITFFVPNVFFSYTISFLWFLVMINAFNFTDNMNGLCSGLGALSAMILAFHAAMPSHYLVASIGFLIAGSMIGFVPFNFPKAQTFLGDGGSHLIGFLISTMAVLPHFYHASQPEKIAVIKPILAMGIVPFDLAWVISLRLWKRQPIYIGDTNHLSHQLVKRGLSERSAVLILWFIHGFIAAFSFLI